MYRPQASRPYYAQDADMYDEEPSRQRPPDDYHRSPALQDHHDSRKDHSRNTYRGSAANRMTTSSTPDRGQWQQNEVIYVNPHELAQEPPRHPHPHPRGDGRGRYNDHDREGYRSPRYGGSNSRSWSRSRSRTRSRSRSRSRSPYYGAPPSRTIILEGIPLNMTQEDVLAIMAMASNKQIFNQIQHGFRAENLQEIRLIRDKKTGLSRQFAFAQFAALENARSFLDRYYPTIQLHGVHDPSQTGGGEGAVIRIAYSREKEERDRAGRNEDDWKCEVCHISNYSYRVQCFRCNAPRTHSSAVGNVGVVTQLKMSTFSGFATTGDSDVSPDNAASQFLILRGLEPGVNEELLAKGVTKLYKAPTNSVEGDVHTSKKTKISSTANDANLGAKDGSLRRVLLVRDRKTDDSWRYGFAEFNSVEDAQAAMAKYNVSERFTIASKPVLVSYIHAGVFVPVLKAPAEDSVKFMFSPLSNPSIKLMYWDEAGYVSELVTAKGDNRSALAKVKESVNAKLAAAAANEGIVSTTKDTDNTKTKKRKAEKESSSSAKKVVAPHLQFWSNRHAELHGLPVKENEEQEDSTTSIEPSKPSKPTTNSSPSQSFADMERKCCLLCSRQFKTEAEVIRHENASQLHRDNLHNEDLKTKALVKLAKSGTKQAEAENSAYRDRARERRQAFNQPKQPAAQHKAARDAIAAVAPNEEDVTPTPSKGAALLGKMGWTAGEGLGAQGTGRKDAIVTEAYTQGVGLGAQGGKLGDAIEEAERSTRGSYADFVSKSKDKAKERFHGMT